MILFTARIIFPENSCDPKIDCESLQATEEKAKVEAEAAACLTRLSLAERLVGGLSSENERWGSEIEKLRHSATTLVGDCMLASGFVSYVGAFDQANRDILWKSVWTPGEKHQT